MRLLLTCQPARRAILAARLQPQRGRSVENRRSQARNSASSAAAPGASWNGGCPPPCRPGVRTPRTGRAAPSRRRACDSGSEVSRRDLLEHVDVQSLVGDQLLEPGVLGLEFLEPFGLVGLHAAVLGKPAMPRRLRDLQMTAHLAEFLAGPEELLPSASLRMI